MSDDGEKGIDIFELITALVLGLGAIGGAWAGFQSGLWGGNQATAYSEAGNMMAEAAAIASEAGTEATEASQTANRDADIDVQAKRLMFDAAKLADSAERDPKLAAELQHMLLVAKYLYAEQLSEDAYKFLGLPDVESFDEITDEQLIAVTEKGLDDKYFDAIYKPSEEAYERADAMTVAAKKKFAEGQLFNYQGDLHAFTGVLYTVVMFLAGIGLVFKTKVRWAFGGLAILGLVFSTIDLAKNPWTKLEAPAPAPAESAEAEPGDAPAAADSAEAE